MQPEPSKDEHLFETGAFPRTVPELYRLRAGKSPQTAAFYHQKAGYGWKCVTWNAYWKKVQSAASGLKRAGLEKGDRLAVMLPTCLAWDVMDKAAMSVGAVVVGVEPHASSEHTNHILRHSETSALLVQDTSLLDNLPNRVLRNLKFVVILKGSPNRRTDIPLIPWQELEHAGPAADTAESAAPESADAATLIYTSGTTGAPKGILYTHGQFMTAVEDIMEAVPVEAGEIGICWLPLANLFQRMANVCGAAAGSAVYFCEDPRKVMECIGEIKPTGFIGVPRFYEKVYEGIQSRIDRMPPLQKWMVKRALQTGGRAAGVRRHGKRPGWALSRLHAVMDRLVLHGLRDVMGGRMRYMITGSAPCPTRVLEFFDALGIPVLEAYGMSENIVPIASNRPGAYRFGSVGKPLTSNRVKLSPEGEILVRGPGLFSGYYKNGKPRRGFTEDGFYASSDYGFFDEQGFLHLTGRKSEIIKTSTGRRISLARVEAVIREIPMVDQVVVIGSGRKVLAGLVTLNMEWVDAHLRAVNAEPFAESCDLPLSTTDRLAEEIARKGQALKPYERLCGCLLLSSPFTVGAGELTPNLKVKRNVIERKYEEEINRLYAEIERTSAGSTRSGLPKEKPVIQCLQKPS